MATKKHGGTWFEDDPDYDYSAEIQKAVDEGNFAKAAYLEKSRNAKINYYGMPYDYTYSYQDYLPSVGKNTNGDAGAAVPAFDKGSYADKADRVLKKADAMNFHYNANADPLYKQIKKNYQNTASDVIENTMGAYAGMTGGVPSSYAASAAAQAGASHLQKADDMIPELYQLAYSKYADDKADLYRQYGIYTDLENQEYSRGRDALSDKRYNEEQQRQADIYDREWQRTLDNDQWNKDIYTAETEKSDAKEAQETASAQITNALLLGQVPSEELITASGTYAPGTTGEMLLSTFQKDENKQAAAERVSNAYMMGVAPSDEDLALLNYPEGTTGAAALAAYQKANVPKVVYAGGGTSNDEQLKKPTKSMYDEIDKLFEEGDGFDGLSKLKSKYDWDTYDEAYIDQYILANYASEYDYGYEDFPYSDENTNDDSITSWFTDPLGTAAKTASGFVPYAANALLEKATNVSNDITQDAIKIDNVWVPASEFEEGVKNGIYVLENGRYVKKK